MMFINNISENGVDHKGIRNKDISKQLRKVPAIKLHFKNVKSNIIHNLFLVITELKLLFEVITEKLLVTKDI